MAEWGDETGMPQIGSSMPRSYVAGCRCSLGCHASLANARQTSTVVDESLNAVRLNMFSQSKRGVRASRCTRLSQGSPRFVFGSPASTVLDKTCERPLHLFWSRGTHSAVLASSHKEDSILREPCSAALHLRPRFAFVAVARMWSTGHPRARTEQAVPPNEPCRAQRHPRHRVWRRQDQDWEFPNDRVRATPRISPQLTEKIGRHQPPGTRTGGRRRLLSWWAPLARARDLHQRTLSRPAPAVPAGRT